MAKMLVPPQFSYYADDAGYTVYDGETPLGPEEVCRMLEKSEADLAHIEALESEKKILRHLLIFSGWADVVIEANLADKEHPALAKEKRL